MKKYLRLFIFTCMFVIILTSCFSKKEVTELTFRITWDNHSGRGESIYSIVDDFNQNHPSINVTMIGGNENREALMEALTEDSIDVYVMPYRYLMDNAINDELVALNKDYQSEWQHYYETLLEMTGPGEEYYGIPWIGHSMALIFNKSLTNEAGINPYQWMSYNQLVEGGKSVYEVTGRKGLGLIGAETHDTTWMVNQFIYTFGGKLVNEETNKIAINSEETKKALDFYINELGPLAQEGWQEDTGVEVLEAFAAEEIAFEIQGPWGVSDIWKKGYAFDVGVIPLSQIGMYSEVGPLMLSISKESQNYEAAKEFVAFMIKKESLEKIMDGEYDPKYDAYYPYRVPLRKDMQESIFFRKYPDFLAFIEGYKRPSISTPNDDWASIEKEIYQKVLHETMVGEKSIEDMLEEVDR